MRKRAINALGTQRETRLPVLLYHHIGPVISESWRGLTVAPASFERQLAGLRAAGFEGISCARWLDWLDGERNLPRKPVLITFDDAYSSLTEHALPVIARVGWAATVFVPTGLIGGEIHRMNASDSDGLPVMDQSQIAHWAGLGIEFGGHSRSHRDLTALTDLELEDEVAGSRGDLEKASGTRVRAFAYPYGRTDQRVTSAVRNAYDAGLTLENGINDARTDRFAMRRSMVQHSDSAVGVWFRVAAGWNPVEAIRTTATKWRKLATA